METNPLRILDTKSPTEHRRAAEGRARLADSLSGESREHFAAVLAMLDRFGVRYRVEERLVRGLDYYTRTVFEIVAEGLGAQDAICGGGRYDGLVAELGGPELPGIGFAIGEDRLLSVLPASFRVQVAPRPPALVAALGQVPAAEALALSRGTAPGGGGGGRGPRRALAQGGVQAGRRLGVERLVLLGDDEVAAGTVTVKNLTTGQQQQVARAALAAALATHEGAEA